MPYLDKPRSRDQRLGQSFRIDDRFERLMTMTEARREDILKRSPTVRTAFGYYVNARGAALRLEQEPTS